MFLISYRIARIKPLHISFKASISSLGRVELYRESKYSLVDDSEGAYTNANRDLYVKSK